ncbi:hypothetical protein M0804_011290 [Polistes exclamans]|nr:hypothetical protein M0804_011290 [Polistes exclamans]
MKYSTKEKLMVCVLLHEQEELKASNVVDGVERRRVRGMPVSHFGSRSYDLNRHPTEQVTHDGITSDQQ